MKKDTKAKFLFDIVKPYKYLVIIIIFLSILGSSFDGISIGLLVPLLGSLQKMESTAELPQAFRWIVQLLKPYSISQQLSLSIAFVILAILLKNLLIALSVRSGHWLSARLLADLRMKAISLLMTVGIEFHHMSKAGDLIDKAVYNTLRVEALIRFSIELVANSLTFAILLLMLFILSWKLTLLTLALGSVFLLFIRYHTRSLSRLGNRSATTGRDLLSAIHESLSGIQLIKSYSKETHQIPLLNQKIEASRQAEYRRNFKVFSVHPITDVLASIAICILFVIAMFIYEMDTKLMLTQLLPFAYILLRIVPLMKILNAQRADIVSKLPYLDLVHELLREDDKPFITDGDKPFPGLKQKIEFRAVTFSYHNNQKQVLNQISFSIPVSKTTAIVGESGAGKSTIAHLLLRLLDPQQGEITIDGEPLQNYRLETYHREISIVSQGTFLFNNTVKLNIAFGVEDTPSDEQIIEAAQKARAHEFIMELPNGYDTFLGDRGVRLSGGQRQRISIARAILRDPEILILDEATSSLDTKTEKLIHDAILELRHGRTVIIIAHRLSTIENADQIIVLKNGQIAEVGNAEQLYGRKGEYYNLAHPG